MKTPITDATMKYCFEDDREFIPADFARRLELDRAALLDALKWLDSWIGHKPMPECSKCITDALSAARANFPD